MDCLFCKILSGEIPSSCVYEDDYTYAFKDISPQMPVHILVIPKKHISSLAEAEQEDGLYLQKVLYACQQVARLADIEKDGYRVVTNVGENACQTVKHLHFHVLGGKMMSEKIV